MSPINPFYCICAECFKYHIVSSKRGPRLASRLFVIKPYKIKFSIRKQKMCFSALNVKQFYTSALLPIHFTHWSSAGGETHFWVAQKFIVIIFTVWSEEFFKKSFSPYKFLVFFASEFWTCKSWKNFPLWTQLVRPLPDQSASCKEEAGPMRMILVVIKPCSEGIWSGSFSMRQTEGSCNHRHKLHVYCTHNRFWYYAPCHCGGCYSNNRGESGPCLPAHKNVKLFADFLKKIPPALEKS